MEVVMFSFVNVNWKAQGDSFKLLVLYNQQSITQIFTTTTYSHLRMSKPMNF